MSILRLRPQSLEDAAATPSLAADLVTLGKPRIAVFVALAAAVGAWLGAPADTPVWEIFLAGVFVMATAAGASAFNQALERDIDRTMERTRERPLPSGRVPVRDAILLATALGVAGVVGLCLCFNLLAAFYALGSLCAYVAVYTPLKRYSTLNTLVGALPGAAPPLVGYVATAGEPGVWAWALFAVIFVWQFPHFLAIAWLYRHDYARAGLKMLPSMPGGEGVAGRASLFYALVLLPVSLLPGVLGLAGWVYLATAVILGAVYALASARFAFVTDRARARALLIVSLVYLPLWLLGVVLDPLVRSRVGG